MRKHLTVCLAVITAILLLSGCQMAEPRPAGVSRFVAFSVSPVYPKSFDITAAADHSFYGHFSVEELKEAWRKKAAEVAEGPEIQNLIVGRTRQRNRYRRVADKVSQRIRDNYADRLANSGNRPNHHFTLAFGPAPAPGWRRLSSPVFSPGTGSPLAVVELVDAQPLNPQMAAVRMANIKRYFIRLGT